MGITVANGNSLTIYGQDKSTGTLIANAAAIPESSDGCQYAAGIGGGTDQAGGTITINGGVIEATGYSESTTSSGGDAGIGGGFNGAGGSVTINGGTVTAEGKDGGKGIGAGKDGQSGGTVNLKWNISVLAGDDESSADFVIPATKFEEYHDQTWVQTTVTVTINSMSINPNTATLTVGDTQVLTATFDPEDATNKTVKWSIGGANASAVSLYSDTDCKNAVELNKTTKTLTVYAKGVSAGKAIVTATSAANPDKSASCDVTVKATLTFDLNGGTLNGNAGPITKEAEVGSTTKLLEAPTKDGDKCGTAGQARRIEAVQMQLSGVEGQHVWYRVHSQDYGWLGWAHDGAEAGTTGLAKRAEAIDVQILPQGQHPMGYDASQAACVSS